MKLKDKVAVVTGAHKGIGKGIAISLALAGAHVFITHREDTESLNFIKNEFREYASNIDFLYADMTNRSSIHSLLNDIYSYKCNIDILVNNAGIIDHDDLLNINEELFDKILHNNVTLPLILTQEVAKHMKKNEIKGSIINISSIRGNLHAPSTIAYCCSKSAINMLTKCAAYELAQYKIRVNAIAPGFTEAGMGLITKQNFPDKWIRRISSIPLQRSGNPLDYGGLAVFLASDESSWMTGEIITIDGGYSLVYQSSI